MINHQVDLRVVARTAMVRFGFVPDFPTAVVDQVTAQSQPAPDNLPAGVRDLRELCWSSIDNRESRDLDQIEYLEPLPEDRFRLLVGIADVDQFVPLGCATDRHASQNATSVYAGIINFPMLPEQLSTNTSSLLEGVDRLAVVIEMVINEQGLVEQQQIYRGFVRNWAKLDYESIGDWLNGVGPLPTPSNQKARDQLEQQLRWQYQLAGRLRAQRARQGALDFETIEATPIVEQGKIVNLVVKEKNPARYLIENLMVTANSVMAQFLEQAGVSSIQRVVRSPERWPRIQEIAANLGDSLPSFPDARALADFLARHKAADPTHFPDLSLAVVKLLGSGEYTLIPAHGQSAGHFGLAAHDYTHSTAPNRRYIDLIIQRLLKAVIDQQPPPYSDQELTVIADHCTERDKAAKKVERFMRKAGAALFLSDKIGSVFDAIVTGVSANGVYLRLIQPPAEGRLLGDVNHYDVGDHLSVRLVSADAERAYIDFVAATSS